MNKPNTTLIIATVVAVICTATTGAILFATYSKTQPSDSANNLSPSNPRNLLFVRNIAEYMNGHNYGIEEHRDMVDNACNELIRRHNKISSRPQTIDFADYSKNHDAVLELDPSPNKRNCHNDEPDYAQTAIDELLAANTFQPIKINQQAIDIIKSYKPKNIYDLKILYISPASTVRPALSDANLPKENDLQYQNDIFNEDVYETGYKFAPAKLVSDYLYPDNAGWTPDSKTIPIVVDYSVAARVTNTKIEYNRKVEDIQASFRKLEELAKGYEFNQCYYNSASTAIIGGESWQFSHSLDTTYTSNRDFDPRTNTTCTPPPVSTIPGVVNDRALKEQLGINTKPTTRMVRFKIVGLYPNYQYIPPLYDEEDGLEMADYLTSNINKVRPIFSPFSQQHLIVNELYNRLPAESKLDDIASEKYGPVVDGPMDGKYIEFADKNSLADYLAKYACTESMVKSSYGEDCKNSTTKTGHVFSEREKVGRKFSYPDKPAIPRETSTVAKTGNNGRPSLTTIISLSLLVGIIGLTSTIGILGLIQRKQTK